MPRTGRQMAERAEWFYKRNPALMDAHFNAARVLADAGIPVSAKFLTEIARYLRRMDYATLKRLIECYEGVRIEKDGEYAIANESTAYLARRLQANLADYPNFCIRMRKSKMDKPPERLQGENYYLMGGRDGV